ncbi:hypothetical protein CGRA01v4_11858 [Colletotrichum graminicola]|nr:hypothetical protein CGRA01v4_11858 [Colletotrichum graminicola]
MQPAPKLKVSPIYPSSTTIGRSGPQHTVTRANSLPAPVFDPRELICPRDLWVALQGPSSPMRAEAPPAATCYVSGSEPKTCVTGFHGNLPVQ